MVYGRLKYHSVEDKTLEQWPSVTLCGKKENNRLIVCNPAQFYTFNFQFILNENYA